MSDTYVERRQAPLTLCTQPDFDADVVSLHKDYYSSTCNCYMSDSLRLEAKDVQLLLAALQQVFPNQCAIAGFFTPAVNPLVGNVPASPSSGTVSSADSLTATPGKVKFREFL